MVGRATNGGAVGKCVRDTATRTHHALSAFSCGAEICVRKTEYIGVKRGSEDECVRKTEYIGVGWWVTGESRVGSKFRVYFARIVYLSFIGNLAGPGSNASSRLRTGFAIDRGILQADTLLYILEK